jgi:DNA-binding transcriptional regulator/RsmH inhibitor MraZ
MEERLVEIPCSVKLRKMLEDLRKQEIEKLEEQIEELKEDNSNAVLRILLENYNATYI